MNRKKPNRACQIIIPVLLLAVLWVTVTTADSIPPQINMNTSMEQYEPGVIRSRVVDDSEVSKVMLFYRKSGETYYNSIDMKYHNNNIFYRELNRELGLEGPVQYYILAQDTSGNQVTEPAIDPEENPMTAAMSGDVDQSAPEVYLSNPEPGAVLDVGDEPIMVTFYMTEREIDFNTIRLKIDKRDRTREVDLAGNILLWEPRRPLRDGYHEIEVIVRDTDGNYLGPNIWTFRVKTKRELPLGAEGDFYLGIQRDDRSGTGHNVPLWNNKLDFGIKGQTGWVNWNAGFMLSSEETPFLTTESLPDRQPINRFYFDGRTRYFRVRLGDSNPNFSELSVKGILIRGLNLHFRSNRFEAQFVKGYNKREIGEDVRIIEKNVTPLGTDSYIDEDGEEKTITSSYQEIVQDPVTGKFHVYEFTPGTFKRDVTALQMDVLPVKNRMGIWKVGFNFFSAEDDSTTLKYEYNKDNEVRFYSAYGDSFMTDYKPKKNWVGTVETSLRFNDNRSVISAEFGGTLATENMFGTISEDLKEELPEDIDDDLFRFNGSTQTSFDKKKIKDSIGKGVGDAVTSVYKIRLNTPVPIPQTSTWFKGEMYRIPTHYVSLGNPQQKIDIGGYKLNVRSRFLRDQLTLNLGYDSYSDNLDNERKQYKSIDPDTGLGSDQKYLTKDTSVASFSVNVRPRMWAEYAPNVTIGYRAYNAKNDLDLGIAANDTTDMTDTSTDTFMFSVGGMLPVGVQRHMGTLSITNMSISDDRPLASYDLNESENVTVMFNVNSAVNPLPLSVTTSIGRTDNTSYRKETTATGFKRKEVSTGITMFTLSGTYKWFRDKRLSTTAGIRYLGSSNGESGVYEIDNTKTSFRIAADYRVTSISSLGAHLRFINYSDNARSVNDYTEPIFGITLRSAF